MDNSLKLKIGDIIISCKSKFPLKPLNKSYDWRFSNFVYKGRESPAIRLKIKVVDRLPKVGEAERLFETIHPVDNADNWRIYKRGGGFVLEQYALHNPGEIEGIIFLNKDFNQGDVYLSDTDENSFKNINYYEPGAGHRRLKIRDNSSIIRKDSWSWNSHQIIYTFLQVLLINYLTQRNGIFFHGTGIKDIDGSGMLFIGPSGAGKSTMARLWHRYSRAKILNDDRMIVRKQNGEYSLYATPWHGDFKDYLKSETEPAKLKKILFIYHSKKNSIKNVSNRKAFELMFPNIFPVFWNENKMNISSSFCLDLIKEIPCFKLGFRKEREIVRFIRSVSHR
ncbi:MAG: hypothetical protein P9L98_03955 [Candidatus Kaelpia imicola]|nr:hypothetical protein [Candidatus Kaelpia imicola]